MFLTSVTHNNTFRKIQILLDKLLSCHTCLNDVVVVLDYLMTRNVDP